MLNLSAACPELTAALAACEAAPAPAGIQAGAILSAFGGYEQTNVNFFLVLERKGAWAKVVAIGKTTTSDGPQAMTGTVLPDASKRGTKVLRRKVHAGYSGREFIYPDGQYSFCAVAEAWDGAPKRFSTYA